MNDSACPRESEVLAAVATESFTEELRSHAVDCDRCNELVLVAGFMNREAEEIGKAGPIPDAGYLWWRASLEQREIRSRRATGIITLVQRVGVVVGALVAFLLLRGIAPEIGTWLAALATPVQNYSLPENAASPILVVLVSLGLLAAPAVFNLYGTWSRD